MVLPEIYKQRDYFLQLKQDYRLFHQSSFRKRLASTGHIAEEFLDF